ncbi:MAG TPA: hypothetical protein VIG77_14305 [Ktedonobacterales bacterium]|jgi:hypothetical protein
MATPQEREAFLRGWHAAMEEALAVLATEAGEWREEEAEASESGAYKLPGSFALEEVQGSFRGRQELLAWITQIGPSASRGNDPALAKALDALIENSATDDDLKALGLTPMPAETPPPPSGTPSTDAQ